MSVFILRELVKLRLGYAQFFCMDVILRQKLKTNKPSVALRPGSQYPAPPCPAGLTSLSSAIHSATLHLCTGDAPPLPLLLQA